MGLILITGANRGIGLELACQYAEAGNSVLATCRSPDEAGALRKLAASYDSVEIFPLDVTQLSSIESLRQFLQSRSAEIEILINNAGVLIAEDLGQWKAESFARTFATNATGPAMVCQALLDSLGAGAKVVNISSGIGSFDLKIGLGGDYSSYAASKSALNMLTVHLAAALKPRGILAVAFSPGWVKTDMGGQEAELEVETSVSSLRAAISRLGLQDAGSLFSYNGEIMPW